MQTVLQKKNIRLLSLEKLEDSLKQWNLPKYRARQIYNWIWHHQVDSFHAMQNIPKHLREKLNDTYYLPQVVIDKKQISQDGTIKNRLKLHDGALIEAVLIPVSFQERFTVCVSSQVGCSLACTFCATGKLKRVRNLTPGEIFDQVRIVNQQCLEKYGKALTNIVFMGMGEPLLNYHNVLQGIQMIHQFLGFSMKRITLSTVGISKIIDQMAEEKVKFNLALSLHAADDEKRSEMMAINDSNNLAILQKSLRNFYQKTRNKITLEYIAFDQFNDTEQDAKNLAEFCKGFPFTINIIEYNPIDGYTKVKSSENRLNTFTRALIKRGITVTVRRSRGRDIDAACGQLANKE